LAIILVVGDQVPRLGVVPKPADIGDELAVMINKRVIDGNHAVLGVAGASVALQQVEPALVKGVCVPIDLGDPAIQAGLIGRDREFTIDATDRFPFSYEQAGQVFGEVLALGRVGKQVVVLRQEVLHDGWELNDRRHNASCGTADSAIHAPHRTTA
jgi:hypothetical protein